MDLRSPTKMKALLSVGQSVWLDYLHRRMTRSGELAQLVAVGLRGMTSNPTIFENAIGASTDYDDDLERIGAAAGSERAVFEALAVQDVREAADVFRPVYDATRGADGFVSLEVAPDLARDTAGSVREARRLWNAVDRPNVMIKIPGTREGWPAIEECLEDGININITLLFTVEHYQAVAEAYLRALESRVERQQPIDRVASVASFFLSRVDTEVDRRIEATGHDSLRSLRGKAAIAGAQLAYEVFTELTESARWRSLASKGARPQRLLWASTGTKNPEYSDVMYVESLIGRDTVATLPPETLTKFEDHGRVSETLDAAAAAEARQVMDALAAAGIEFRDVNHTLEKEGIDKFANAFDALMQAVARKRAPTPHT
jgi:transaldolase